MQYIDEDRIYSTLEKAQKAAPEELERILEKSKALQRLSLYETAVLLMTENPEQLAKIYAAAAYVKEAIYGKRVVLFTPLYISSICSNNCLYCAFHADNKEIERRALSPQETKAQTELLLKRGHKRILLVAGEAAPKSWELVDYYVESIKAIYDAQVGPHKIKRVNINCAPLSVAEFKRLKTAGIGTYQIFQETYHEETYRKYHVRGPKSDPNNRITAIDRAFEAGVDDIGIGVLYGLYDYRFDTLAMLSHVEHMEEKYKVGPHTISVPRIEPAQGSSLSLNIPHKVSDADFQKIVAIIRLSVPYTGLILSTRETATMRDTLIDMGVSQISAESSTTPGQNDDGNKVSGQFSTADHRSLDEIVGSLIDKGFIPSYCAACYRSERTGEKFMDLAKPGNMKGCCSLNALVTLREYLDDFAPDTVKTKGYALIENMKDCLGDSEKQTLQKFFDNVIAGKRDQYI